jgi:ATP phosphoribosyltransferase regulatory subunit
MEAAVKQDPPGAIRAARPAGLLDLLPGQAGGRRALESAILESFEAWGYELIATPSLELVSTIELGVQPEQVRRLFKLADADGRMLALVGERTVPVARVAAGQLRQAPRPLRLCYLGRTYQALPAAGGRREALQAGAELIGVHSPMADTEVVAMAIGALLACGLPDFQVEVGHVGFFRGLMAGLQEAEREMVADALAGRDLVELERALTGTALGEAERDLLLRFPAMRGGPEILDAAAALVTNQISAEAIAELRAVFALLEAHGVADRVNLDLGAVRDFDYYTGLVFEAFTPGMGIPLAVGGRYDSLLRRFGEDTPATGLVVFLDRVHDALGERAPAGPHRRLVMVAYAAETGGGPAGHSPAARRAVALAAELRAAGRRVVLEAEPLPERDLRRRARALKVDELVLCEGEEAFVLDGAGRRALEPGELEGSGA